MGTFFAFLLGVIFFYVFRIKSISSFRQKDDNMKRGIIDSGYEIRSDPTNGECRPEEDSDPDVIIVGAGVAGAALAYTLGKVSFMFLSLVFHKVAFYFILFFLFKSRWANRSPEFTENINEYRMKVKTGYFWKTYKLGNHE